MRKILFNGLLIADEIKIVIPSVTVYDENEMGCSEAAFNAILAAAGCFYDSDDECFYRLEDATKREHRINGGNIRSGNDWIYFTGTPLQYIGIDDKAGKKIFDGDYCKCDDGFEGIIEYEQQGACFVLRSKFSGRHKSFDGGGQYGDADGIQQQNMESLGNVIAEERKIIVNSFLENPLLSEIRMTSNLYNHITDCLNREYKDGRWADEFRVRDLEVLSLSAYATYRNVGKVKMGELERIISRFGLNLKK